MRLAVVVDTFPRWSERFIARELNELLRRGVDLTVFALRKGRLPPGGDPEWEALLPRLRVLPPVPSTRNIAEALSAVPRLPKAGAWRRLLAVESALGSVGVLRCSRAHVLSRWLREGGFTRVHAHFANWPSTIAWIAAREVGLPLSLSFHARDLFVEAQLMQEKARDAEALFTCWQLAHEKLVLCPGAETKACLMPHGLPLDLFPFRGPPVHQAPLRGGWPLLAAGRFVAKKGFADLLDALTRPPLVRRALTLTILGDGPERGALQRLVARRGLGAKVRLRPPETWPDLRRQFSAAALFVAPYRSGEDGDRDGIPNVVLESFALGVPVVGTNAGGLPEVLNERTGYPVQAGDAAALARAIAACLDDAQGAAEKTRMARKLVEERHDIGRSLEPLVKVLGLPPACT